MQPSQADKNRAALAAAKLKIQTQKLFEQPRPQRSKEQQRIIQIGGLVEELEDFDEQNIKDVKSWISFSKCMVKSSLSIFIKKRMEKTKVLPLSNLKITEMLELLSIKWMGNFP